MDRNLTMDVMGLAMAQVTRPAMKTGAIRKAVRREYRRILSRAGDIGKRNPLLSCYAMAAWFIAMNRMDHLSPEENGEIMLEGFRKSRIFAWVMGDADHYLDPKRIEQQKKWAEETHQKRYADDWVLDCLPGNGDYALGYDYWECGICKLCRAEGCPELARYLCQLDFLFAEVMGLRLERSTTLAQGGEKCDFRFYRA